MNEVHDFNKVKKAKRIVKDLETVLKILKLSKKGLNPFREYTSLQETLLCIEDSITILDIHFEQNKKVLEEKGQINEK